MASEAELLALVDKLQAVEVGGPPLDVEIGGLMAASGWHAADCMRRFTTSIDAALALCEPDWWVNMSAPLSPAAYGYSREDARRPRAGMECIGYPYSSGARAATMALAICAMAIRVRAIRAATMGGSDD
jgi:hypothetical protein